ncbi:hypothetical protein F383_07930 [Gossypium arboreum]|uniref:Uncharacterized protein n=1 Tax=Gossypium arboreum TaxID=29729 RepID=A0A0B0PKY5_GOSAR|nr:hypothetical protein F383_07930 [Gossypium arboreum]
MGSLIILAARAQMIVCRKLFASAKKMTPYSLS